MQEGRFVLKSPFKPQGDQPQAIEALTQGVQSGMPCQVLLGVPRVFSGQRGGVFRLLL